MLRQYGHQGTVYRLAGYIFFGSAIKIEALFKQLDIKNTSCIVIDFSHIDGIDRSAIKVFERILQRSQFDSTHFYFSSSPKHLKKRIEEISSVRADVSYFATFDHALEAAEEFILSRVKISSSYQPDFLFFKTQAELDIFKNYCVLKQVNKGEPICIEQDLSKEMFFIVDGSFEITKKVGDRMIRLAKINADNSSPTIVGEMAFYTDSRSATITALSEGRVYVLEEKVFNELRQAHPAIASIIDNLVIHKLANNLVRSNQLIERLS